MFSRGFIRFHSAPFTSLSRGRHYLSSETEGIIPPSNCLDFRIAALDGAIQSLDNELASLHARIRSDKSLFEMLERHAVLSDNVAPVALSRSSPITPFGATDLTSVLHSGFTTKMPVMLAHLKQLEYEPQMAELMMGAGLLQKETCDNQQSTKQRLDLLAKWACQTNEKVAQNFFRILSSDGPAVRSPAQVKRSIAALRSSCVHDALSCLRLLNRAADKRSASASRSREKKRNQALWASLNKKCTDREASKELVHSMRGLGLHRHQSH